MTLSSQERFLKLYFFIKFVWKNTRTLMLKYWNSLITQHVINETLYCWLNYYHKNMLKECFCSYIDTLLNDRKFVKISSTKQAIFHLLTLFQQFENETMLVYVSTVNFEWFKYIISLRDWIVSAFQLWSFCNTNLMKTHVRYLYNVFEVIRLNN